MTQGSGQGSCVQLQHVVVISQLQMLKAQIIPAKAGINLISKSLLQFSLFTKPSQFQGFLLANLLHLVQTMSPLGGSVPPEIRSHAHLKTLLLESSKPICSLTNICRGFRQLFQLGISCILKINAESFTNVHCPLVQTNEKRLFLEVK
jgi:hypothetical protein